MKEKLKNLGVAKQIRLAISVAVVGLVLTVIGVLIDLNLLCAIGLIVTFLGVIFRLLWITCPHCGQPVGRDVGEFCTHCGEKLD